MSRARLPALHCLGAAVGGFVTGACLGLVGLLPATLIGPGWHETGVTVIAAALVLFGVMDVTNRWAIWPGWTRQTPRIWSCTLGPRGASLAWGADLAQGVTTRLHNQGTILVPLVPLAAGDYGLAVAGCVGYGLGRAVTVGLIALLPAWERLAEGATDHVWALRRVAGALELIGGVTAILLIIR